MRSNPAAGLDHLWRAASGAWACAQTGLFFYDGTGRLPHIESIFEPIAQGAVFQNENWRVEQRLFVPGGDRCAVYLWAMIRNISAGTASLRLEARGIFGAQPSAMHRRQPAPKDLARQFKPTDQLSLVQNWSKFGALQLQSEDGEWIRLTVSGSQSPTMTPEAEWTWNETVRLAPAETGQLWLCLEMSGAPFDSLPPQDALSAYASACEQARTLNNTAHVGTPMALVDEGVARGKLNTARVSQRFRMGRAFTNDPPGTLVVTRDAAWFSMGASYFEPEHCRAMWETLTRWAPYPSGKIAEYLDFNADPIFREDYGLNISDPTPLYILGVTHHAELAGDLAWARQVYPTVLGAADYILSQTRANDLVYCSSIRTEPCLGQCGWRNVMDNTTISGAVTELQAECIAALKAAGRMARALGDAASAERLESRAEAMRVALNEKLWDEANGRFRLASFPEKFGEEYGRNDTVDQIFPILLDVTSPERARQTLNNIRRPAYSAPHGIRTVPTDSPAYHPSNLWGLTGGVWPNAVAWVAMASARFAPAKAARLMETIAHPLRPEATWHSGALVPGQFPEFFDGDAAVSKGMALSPWLPPTYVWLVLEGLLGLKFTFEGLTIRPNLPQEWPAAFARNLRCQSRLLSVLITPQAIYSTLPVEACDRPVILCHDVTDDYTGLDRAIVMLHEGGTVAYRIRTHPAQPWTNILEHVPFDWHIMI